MKVESKVLMINIENEIEIGNGGVVMNVIHQVCLFENKDGKVDCDVDFMDVTNVKFMGMPIGEHYKDFKNFKDKMEEFGININQLIDEACEGIITSNQILNLKLEYGDIVLSK